MMDGTSARRDGLERYQSPLCLGASRSQFRRAMLKRFLDNVRYAGMPKARSGDVAYREVQYL